MTRYEDETPIKQSRSSRNKELYERLNDANSFTTYTNINETNAIVLDATEKNYRTREGYQKIKDYTNLVPKPKVQKELDDFNHLYSATENKVYDINSVIEEAKRNRKEKDELEEKRKLKDTSYNVLNLDKEKIEEYKRNRNKVIRADSEEFKDIINTITTKAINGEIDRETSVNLLSDLMATQAMDMVQGIDDNSDSSDSKLENSETKKDILSEADLKLVEEKKIESDLKDKQLQEKNQSKNIFKDMDQSFYTRSMDLSDKDFDLEIVDDDAKKSHVGIKVFFTILLLIVVGVLIYYIVKKGI